jgi:tripartite-type tricarboxylate transporter receptor subunit TctC
MKRIIVGFILTVVATYTMAAEQVKVYWGFAPTSSSAMMVRELIDNMNRQQDKYQFIFVHKPGIGGSIAASSMLADKSTSVLLTSSSFYIRPLLFKDSHDVTKFSIINSVCMAQPIAIFSKNKNILEDAKTREITIGINPGSIGSLAVRSLKKDNPSLKIIEVPFKSTPEATLFMMGGHVDSSVEFVGQDTLANLAKDVHVLGITGVEAQPGFKTFSRQGIKGLEGIVADYYVFVNKNMSSTLQKELHDIIKNGMINKAKSLCEYDFGYVKYTPLAEAESIDLQNQKKWKELVADVEKE